MPTSIQRKIVLFKKVNSKCIGKDKKLIIKF